MRVDHHADIRDRTYALKDEPRPLATPAEVEIIARKQAEIERLFAEIEEIAAQIGACKGHRIARACAKAHGVKWNDMISHRRDQKFVIARHHAWWEMREHTTLSYPAIGRIFGGRDHSTIIYGCRQHEIRMKKLEANQ